MLMLWLIAALLIAALLVYVASLRTRQMLPALELPPGESLPKTRVEQYAGRCLLGVAALASCAAAVVVWAGPAEWWETDAVRLTFTLLLLAALLVYLIFTVSLRRLEARDDGTFDERDQVIIGRSSAGVGGAMMITVAAWMIALTEGHRDTGLVPAYYLYLMFWSCVMMNVVASLAGILMAYRKS